MRLRVYVKLLREIAHDYLPHNIQGYNWALLLVDAVYEKAPVHVIEWHIKNLAARSFDETLCGALASAYLDAFFFAMFFQHHDLIVHIDAKIKRLGVPCVVIHQPPLKRPYVMLFEDPED